MAPGKVTTVRNPIGLPLALLALLAAAPLAAQKPGAGDGDGGGARDRYRGQGVSICIAELRTADGLTPDDLEAICGCAFDRYLPGHDAATLPPVAPATLRSTLWPHLMSCAADREPRLSVAVARRLADSPRALAPSADPAAPPVAAVPVAAGPSADKPAGGEGAGLRGWWNGLGAPAWLSESGIPAWGWILIAALGLLLLRTLFRRRDGRGDLTGPPRHMRPSGRAPHLPPRG